MVEARQSPDLKLTYAAQNVRVLTPMLPPRMAEGQKVESQRVLLDAYLATHQVRDFVAWYYSPMALQFSDHLMPAAVVYDCMDELSAFQGAPPAMVDEEQRLFERADVVFTGGASLYASKKSQHANVHLFPSSIDYAHFAAARANMEDPSDQANIPHPRIGFYGVIDERLDCDLLRRLACRHPDWQFILIGPVVKIREEDLPRADNLHYLGQKSYNELPAYLGRWDVAMLPFARNASTRFISPTKTPEYLAGGKPVVSTAIADVIKPYGEMGLVYISQNADEFAHSIKQALEDRDPTWLARVDAFLAESSWDKTFDGMWKEIQRCKSQAPVRSTTKQ